MCKDKSSSIKHLAGSLWIQISQITNIIHLNESSPNVSERPTCASHIAGVSCTVMNVATSIASETKIAKIFNAPENLKARRCRQDDSNSLIHRLLFALAERCVLAAF